MARGPRPLSLKEFTARFWARVDSSGGPDACWPWTGATARRGYGAVGARGLFGPAIQAAHRVAWWLTHGEWPEPECLHHCDNPPCCNPAHLFEGTQAANVADALAKGRIRRGELHGMVKLTAAQVAAIRADSRIQRLIALEYGISQGHVSDIKARHKWASTRKGS